MIIKALMKAMNFRDDLATRKKEDGFTLLELVIWIAIMGVFMGVAILGYSQYREKALEATESNQTSTPEPDFSTVSSGESSIDFPIGTVLASMTAIVVIVASGYFLFTWALNSKRKADHAKEIKESEWEANTNAWNKLFAQHDELVNQWAEYELNMEMLIKYPVLTDVSHPKVQRLHKAIQEASLTRPDKADRNVFPVDGAYGKAVVELSGALTSAVNEAKKVAWSNFTTAERRRLQTAIQMLKMAQDAGASPHERQAAYKRVQIELDGLVVVPDKPMEVIEAAIRKAIEPATVAV